MACLAAASMLELSDMDLDVVEQNAQATLRPLMATDPASEDTFCEESAPPPFGVSMTHHYRTAVALGQHSIDLRFHSEKGAVDVNRHEPVLSRCERRKSPAEDVGAHKIFERRIIQQTRHGFDARCVERSMQVAELFDGPSYCLFDLLLTSYIASDADTPNAVNFAECRCRFFCPSNVDNGDGGTS